VEEYVFRIDLPRFIERLLNESLGSDRTAVLLGTALAQVSFALAHAGVLAGLSISIAVPQFLRLVFAGVCFSAVIEVWGIGLTAALHAALNFFVMAGPDASTSTRFYGIALSLSGLACLACMSTVYTMLRRTLLGTRASQKSGEPLLAKRKQIPSASPADDELVAR